ncbi:MAG: preQ(1) synthase [Burkholderiaceae bacterium]
MATRTSKPGKSTAPSKTLETFPNPAPARDYLVHIEVPEFTCLCPMTGQPDFATITLDYVPDKKNVELKALKLYMWSYRNEGAFHEAVTNLILDDLVKALSPRFLRITAKWWVRGGIYTNVVAEHRKRGWKPAPAIDLPSFEAGQPMRG